MLLRRNLAHAIDRWTRPGAFYRCGLLMWAICAVVFCLALFVVAAPVAAQNDPVASPVPPPTKTSPPSTPVSKPTVAEAAPAPDEILAADGTSILTDTTSLPPESSPNPDVEEEAAATSELAAPIDYSPTFAEVECPFVVPWSQTIICGTLTVPEVRANPESAQIRIFVMILKSLTTPLTDPILVLPGGPGSAGSQSRNLFYGLPSHRNRDVILMDPRGTGYSFPSLDCFEVNDVGFTYADTIEATQACHERLVGEGRDLAGYVSSEQVQDVADLAKVLGFGKINLYATSYGTRIAVLLADKYPVLVRSMVLDGVLPVAVNSLLEEPLNDYGVLQRIAQDCVEDPMCNGSFPALEARLLEVIDRYNRAPLPDDIGYGSGDAILKFIFKQMYGGGAQIPAFITALYYEDFAQACTLLPPAVGCFFAQADMEAGDIAPLYRVPTEEEAALGINLLEPEIGARQLITWERWLLPLAFVQTGMPSSPGTTAAPVTDSTLVELSSVESGDAESGGAESVGTGTGGTGTVGAGADEAAQEDEDAPPWRAHFTRPEDPYGPDLDRISWLMHDRGFAQPEELFAWLDSLNEEEVQEMLRTIPKSTFDSFSEGAYASVICAEEAPFYTLEDIAHLASRIPQQFGALLTHRAQEVKEICAFWEAPPVMAARKMTLPSAVPALVTNGTHDAVTPAVWAERAALYLYNVWLRLFPGYGHAILSTGDLCMQQMMENFYTNPEQDPSPPCFRDLRVEFTIP